VWRLKPASRHAIDSSGAAKPPRLRKKVGSSPPQAEKEKRKNIYQRAITTQMPSLVCSNL
jgi:hypothetical protein